MDVFVANEQDIPVDAARLSALARHTLDEEEVDPSTELSVLFVTSEHIRKLNARFAGDDYATDVLAFPMMEDDENVTLLGDVVICPRVAESNAHKLGHALTRELDTLVVHGTLHLLGYDHQGKQDGELMNRRLQEVMGSFEASTET
jgi:probable rRNA maturation factor